MWRSPVLRRVVAALADGGPARPSGSTASGDAVPPVSVPSRPYRGACKLWQSEHQVGRGAPYLVENRPRLAVAPYLGQPIAENPSSTRGEIKRCGLKKR